ncbi:hypothetical protein ACFV6F_16265 [Kitasatospora phosalacinea]|uniref:hypothetical protein n=1 Tax=Kitasatospora phosalacinea TaxID=2065 RepID=UPI0036519257
MVTNDGGAPLELAVEPWADTHWLQPQQTCVVITHSPAADGSWSGSRQADEPFHVVHGRDLITVWANGHCFHLTDTEGRPIDASDREECPARSGAA